MLKLLWSWTLLIAITSILILYKPELLNTEIDIIISGSKFSIHSWVVYFLEVVIIVIVLSLANIMFFFQRRTLINRCKKLHHQVKSVGTFTELLNKQSGDKLIAKTIKALPLAQNFKNEIGKGLFKETSDANSTLSLWWHGHWIKLADSLLYKPVETVWYMNLCCHMFLIGAISQQSMINFVANWDRHAVKMHSAFPTVALRVQQKIFAYYTDVDQLQQAWLNLSKKLRKDSTCIITYMQAIAKFEHWSEVQKLFEDLMPNNSNNEILTWYCCQAPVNLLDINKLQKWHAANPNKFLLYALARAYASTQSWSTLDMLIKEVDDQELTFKLQLQKYAASNEAEAMLAFIKANFL